MRVVMQELALFLLPLLLFVTYVWLRNALAQRRGQDARPIESGPIYWSLLIGLACALAGILVFGLHETTGTGADIRYEPPKVINGEVVPGRVYKKE